MGILDRFASILGSSVSELERAPDAESLLTQALTEMDRELARARSLHEEGRHAASLKQQLMLRRKEEAALFRKRADEARAEGRQLTVEEQERFEKKALSAAEALEKEAREADARVVELKVQADALERAMGELRGKVSELSERLRQVRMNAPRDAPGLGATPPPPPPPPSGEPYPGGSYEPDAARNATDWELERLAKQAAVEEKLAALKKKMKGGGG